MAAQYLRRLRSVIKEHPRLRPYVKKCRHCKIFFLTDPRNAHRNDIDCPFGCRQTHRKQCAKQRSTAYYQTPEGKFKKKQLNARRSGQDRASPKLDTTLIVHLKVVTSLIEARPVGLAQIIFMVKSILRQLSLDNQANYLYQVLHADNLPP